MHEIFKILKLVLEYKKVKGLYRSSIIMLAINHYTKL